MKEKIKELGSVVNTVEGAVRKIESNADRVSKPVRNSLIKRFPIVAVLLIAFGVAATVTAAQMIFMQSGFFSNHPWILLILGISILVFMGKLHQKLG